MLAPGPYFCKTTSSAGPSIMIGLPLFGFSAMLSDAIMAFRNRATFIKPRCREEVVLFVARLLAALLCIVYTYGTAKLPCRKAYDENNGRPDGVHLVLAFLQGSLEHLGGA